MQIQMLIRPAFVEAFTAVQTVIGTALSLDKAAQIVLSKAPALIKTLPSQEDIDLWTVQYVAETHSSRRSVSLSDAQLAQLDQFAAEIAPRLPERAQWVMREPRSKSGRNRTFALYLALRLYGEKMRVTAE